MALINAGTGIVNTGDNTGVLDIQGGGVTGVSINVNGMYVKSVTTTQMNALTAVNGMIVFNTTLAKMCQYVNNAWQQMTSVAAPTGTQRGIFGYGVTASTVRSMTNLVSNTGVVAADTTGVGTARLSLAAASYGGDKAVFAFGQSGAGSGASGLSITNLVSNAGVVATDSSTTATVRTKLAGASYGGDKAIFGYGSTTDTNTTRVSISNLFSNVGVMAADTTGVGTARYELAAVGYGGDKSIFGFGYTTSSVAITNLVSNTGVVATDTAGVATVRRRLAACGYGSTGQAIFGYGFSTTNNTSLVSNTGVMSADTTGVGTARQYLAATGYGGDKGIFGYGSSALSMTNLVSNIGVVATDTTGVGTGRGELAAAGYSFT
jgi:hypothetical protein